MCAKSVPRVRIPISPPDYSRALEARAIKGSFAARIGCEAPLRSARVGADDRPETGPSHPKRRGGRAVECGGLENRFTGNPGDQGSNPCPSASLIPSVILPKPGKPPRGPDPLAPCLSLLPAAARASRVPRLAVPASLTAPLDPMTLPRLARLRPIPARFAAAFTLCAPASPGSGPQPAMSRNPALANDAWSPPSPTRERMFHVKHSFASWRRRAPSIVRKCRVARHGRLRAAAGRRRGTERERCCEPRGDWAQARKSRKRHGIKGRR